MRYVLYGFAFMLTAVTLVAFQNCTTAGNLRVKDPVVKVDASDVKLRLQAAEKTCQDFQGQKIQHRLPAGSKIEGSSNVVAKIAHLDSISGSGNLVLMGDSPNAKIASLGAFQGNVYLCGVSVDLVGREFRGNLIAVGGAVSKLDAEIANYTLLGAKHGTLPSGFRGSLVAGDTVDQGQGLTYSGQ